ncbi:Pkinase-domain-containing protein [Ceraceosorus guamensis]|uniref:Pkinase-domain-containing protein n=1 Tax=Ceraceosorus guamensis TaxID=1522189 RepID=A0A316VYH3_9BASI|nr:Pkinase-domain-containing protein [Ceraceosorus guamensis]PWN42686.1 Pkinase-domain-containing protein [Ceraceosorus guamensis]
MRNLKHPGIVQLMEFSESRDHYFLVLELLEGGELFHQIVKLTYFSESLARHVILQVAHGIRYLHEERGVVHRDIKPENLLFESINIIPSKQNKARPYDEEKEDEGEFMPGIGGGGIGRVKIADFGLSKVVWEESTMTPCGTVGYTAPEIVKDERYSKSVDMWALGCVLYTLLCGFPPFYDESISVLTEKVAKGYYTFLSPWWDDISDSSKDLITHLLCVDSSKRYTIDEFLAHPWCNVRETLPALNSADIQLAKESEMPLDSPLLTSMKQRRAAMMSPGINQLKEAFDVTYAVHRMEEEGARKRGGAGQAPLNGLNEEDEDDDAEQVRSHHGDAAAQAVEQRRRQKEQEQRARQQAEQNSQNKQQQQSQQQAAQHYQGRGGADRKLAEAALYDGRAGTRDRGSNRRKNFELNIGNATLLGRRNKGPLGEQPSIHAQMFESNHPHNAVDGAGKAALVPGSPMHIDQ